MEKRNLDEMDREQLLAHSRMLESRMNVLRANAGRNEQHEKSLKDATSEFQEISRKLGELDEQDAGVSPEGTSPTLADAEGNFAKDVETARVGGVGINDSNTNPDEARKEMPAQSVEEAQKRAEEQQKEQQKGSEQSSQKGGGKKS